MTDREELAQAFNFVKQGDRKAARTLVIKLERQLKEPSLRLQLISLAISALDNITDNNLKITLSIEGARIAENSHRKDHQAQFMAKTAELLMYQLIRVWHQRAMLKLAPGWFQFATIVDKEEFDALDSLIRDRDRYIAKLLDQAISLAENSGNAKAMATVLASRAVVRANRYLQFMTDCINGIRAKLWIRFKQLRSPWFEYLLTFSNGDARRINTHIKEFTADFIKAAQLADGINDVTAGYVYRSLAIYLKSANRFSAARRYSAKAHAIASRHGDKVLTRELEQSDKIIDAKNTDIPDYLRGESRESN